jgi:outer membrane protein
VLFHLIYMSPIRFLAYGIALCISLLPTSLLQAQSSAQNNNDTLKLSLKQAQEYALAHNLNISNAKANVSYAHEKVNELKGIALPQVSGNLQYLYNIQLPAQLVPSDAFGFPPFLALASGDTLYLAQASGEQPEFQKLTFGTKNNLSLNVAVSQLIFDGSYTLGMKAVNMFIDRAQHGVTKSENDIKQAVIDAYTMTLLAKDNVNILNKNIAILKKILNETSEFNKAGFVEQLDVDRLQLSLSNLQVQIKTAERNAELALGLLKFHLGIDLNTPLALTDSLNGLLSDTEKELAVSPLQYVKEAIANRYEIKALQTEKTFADLDIQQIKAKYLPTVAAFLQTQAAFQSDGFNIFKTQSWIPSTYIGLQVSVPIFDGFQKRAQIAQRVILKDQVFYQEDLMQQVIAMQVAQAHTQYVSAYESYKMQQKNIELAQKIHNVTLIKYKEGVGASLEVTDAESKLFEAQAIHIKMLYDLVVAKNALYKAIGR